MVSQKYSALSSELFLLSLSFGGLHLVNIEAIQMCIANLGPALKRPPHAHVSLRPPTAREKVQNFVKQV